MLARSHRLVHPSGIEVETPLLVPSFSSKGFSFKKKQSKDDPDVSEVVDALEFSKEFLTESILISAYDIYHQHITFKEQDIFTEVTFIDSGGYETGAGFDMATTTKYNYDLKQWDKIQLEEVLSVWPKHKSAIVVSYDHGNRKIPLIKQIANAEALFSKFPEMANDFLIKPETTQQKYIQIDHVIRSIKKLAFFNIIGVTEKELGYSILQRMQNIAKIRIALDKKHNPAPIHIFGSLDPITSILYFLAGAEIFDGLTWLKYSYFTNAAIYTSNFGVLNAELGINVRDEQVKSIAISKNTYYLEKMKYTMKDFLKHKNFELFDNLAGKGFGKIIERSYRTFESNL